MRHLVLAGLLLLPTAAFADGDVTATMIGRTLTLVGDAGSNMISIASGGSTGALTITPTGGTLLNGEAVAGTFLSVRSVTATMGEGDDRIAFGAVRIRGNVRVRLEDGNDAITFTGTSVIGRTRVDCGAGLDLVRTESGAVFFGPVHVRGDSENDEFQLTSAAFRQRVHLDGGLDDDHVLLQSVSCSDQSRLEVFGSRGLDLVEVVSCTFSNELFADMGPGDDRLRIASTRFEDDVLAFGGNGLVDVLSLESGNTYLRLQRWDDFEAGQP